MWKNGNPFAMIIQYLLPELLSKSILIPALNFISMHILKYITGEFSTELAKANKVTPKPILFKNEQKYADVVDILDQYETLKVCIAKQTMNMMTELLTAFKSPNLAAIVRQRSVITVFQRNTFIERTSHNT